MPGLSDARQINQGLSVTGKSGLPLLYEVLVFLTMLALVIYTILEWLVRRKTPGRKRPWTGRAILEVFEEFSVVAQVFKDGSRLWLPPPFSDDQQILWGVLNLPNIADFLTSLEAGT